MPWYNSIGPMMEGFRLQDEDAQNKKAKQMEQLMRDAQVKTLMQQLATSQAMDPLLLREKQTEIQGNEGRNRWIDPTNQATVDRARSETRGQDLQNSIVDQTMKNIVAAKNATSQKDALWANSMLKDPAALEKAAQFELSSPEQKYLLEQELGRGQLGVSRGNLANNRAELAYRKQFDQQTFDRLLRNDARAAAESVRDFGLKSKYSEAKMDEMNEKVVNAEKRLEILRNTPPKERPFDVKPGDFDAVEKGLKSSDPRIKRIAERQLALMESAQYTQLGAGMAKQEPWEKDSPPPAVAPRPNFALKNSEVQSSHPLKALLADLSSEGQGIVGAVKGLGRMVMPSKNEISIPRLEKAVQAIDPGWKATPQSIDALLAEDPAIQDAVFQLLTKGK